MVNKKASLLLIALLILVVGMAAVSAADDTASDSSMSTSSSDVTTISDTADSSSSTSSSSSSSPTSSSSVTTFTSSHDTSSSSSSSDTSTKTDSSSGSDVKSTTTTTAKDTTSSSQDTSSNNVKTQTTQTSSNDVKSVNTTTNSDTLKTSTEDNDVKTLDSASYSVNSYDELVSTIEDIKQGSVEDNVISLTPNDNEDAYLITGTIQWGSSDASQTATTLTILGNGVTLHGGETLFMNISNGYTVNIENLNIKDSNLTTDRGILCNNGTLSLTNALISNISGTNGAVYNIGNATITNVSFINNTSTNSGGAIYNVDDSILTLLNSTFEGNYARYGGAICSLRFDTIIIKNCVFSNNEAGYQGGTMYTYMGDMIIDNCTFVNSTSNAAGGSLYLASGNFTITNSYIANSTDTIISTNYYGRGGAISSTNSVSGLYSNLTIENVTFENNEAVQGGAIYQSGSTTVIINNATFINNTSIYQGGAIYNSVSETIINNTSFIDNTAEMGGGAIFSNSILTLTNNYFEDNYGEHNETLYLNNSDTTLTNNTIVMTPITENVTSTVLLTSPIIDLSLPDVDNVVFTIYNGDEYECEETGELNTEDNTVSTSYTFDYSGLYNVYINYDDYDAYTNNTIQLMIDIIKFSTELDVTRINDTKVGSTVTITGSLTQDNKAFANQPINIIVNDEVIETSTDGDGVYSVEYNITSIGEKTVTVTYEGDQLYNISTTVTTFNVEKIDTALTISSIDDTYVGNTVTITGILTDEYNQILPDQIINIAINDDDVIETSTNSEGIYIEEYEVTSSGEKNVKVTYPGTDWYDTFTTRTFFDANQVETILTVNPIEDTVPGETVTITGSLIDEFNQKLADQEISITVNNEIISTTTDNDGVYTINYTVTTAGTYNVDVNYAGDDKYNKSSVSTSFNVVKVETTLTVSRISDVIPGATVIITGSLVDEDGQPLPGQEVSITVNNEIIPATTDGDGVYTVSYVADIAGLNEVIVNYAGTNKYVESSASTSFNVAKIETTLTVSPIGDVVPGETVTITGSLVDEDGQPLPGQEISITVNNEIIPATTDGDGVYTVSYVADIAGLTEVIVNYAGTNKYVESSASTSFNVAKIETTLTVSRITDTVPGETITITGSLLEEDGQPLPGQEISITVNNEIITATTNGNGVYTVPYTVTVDGTYTVSVNYAGSDRYVESATSTTFNVEKVGTLITVNSVTGQYGNTVKLTAIVTDTEFNNVNDGRVVFKLNGVTIKDEEGNQIYADVVNGIATMDYTITNNVGTYNISATYSGNNYYNGSKTDDTAKLTVVNGSADLKITPLQSVILSGDTITLTAVVSNDGRVVNGGIVIFKLNGVTLKNADGGNLNATVVNGVASVDYTIPVDYSAKDYVLTAVYSAKNYERLEDNTTITLTRSNITTTLEPVIIPQGTDANIKVVLYDQNGNQLERSTKVAVKVNGKTLANTNTTNGVLDITIPTADFKNPYYNLTIVFGENSAYNELRINSVIVVDPNLTSTATTSISMLGVDSSLTSTVVTTDIVGATVSSNSNGTIIKED